MPIWKLIVEGDTPTDVHGVSLRESIHKTVCKMNAEQEILKGNVRNIKGSNFVEIICEADTDVIPKKLKELIIKEIPKNNPLVDMKSIDIGEMNEITDDSLKFDGFKLVREDELTEMVWALQAAGKAFFSQDIIRERNLMRGLAFEMDHIKRVLVQIDDDTKNFEGKINLILIENIIKEPPYNPQEIDDELMYDLYSLYEYCQYINMIVGQGDGIKVPLDEIRKLIGEMEPKFPGLAKNKDNNIKMK